jgi:elongation factor G
MVLVNGQVPLAELENYQSMLKSMTGGHGSYEIEFSHYDPIPPNIQSQLAEDYRPAPTND